jgi:hypothetical protein
MSWDCFGTLCLAMTKGACLARAKVFRNVVRGFSLGRTTLKGRTTKVGMPRNDSPICHCERSVAIS